MARIRTIKPDFPQSESMGRVSRDARLLFVLLWTIADDSGVARGNSRILASLLFPYDDDAITGIEDWLTALEAENCIIRYKNDGATFVRVLNWSKHQKIDKPTPSKLPLTGEAITNNEDNLNDNSRGFAKVREDSMDSRLGREGKGVEVDISKPNGLSVASVETTTAERIDNCPHDLVLGLYAKTLPTLPQPLKSRWASSKGAVQLRMRWREDKKHQDPEFWEWFFSTVATNPHWMGRNDRNWTADLHWLLKRENFDKVLARGLSL